MPRLLRGPWTADSTTTQSSFDTAKLSNQTVHYRQSALMGRRRFGLCTER